MSSNLSSQVTAGTVVPSITPSIRLELPAVEDIQEWLALQISEQIGADPDEIDVRKPFSSYGLTSMQATAIALMGQQQFEVALSPLMMWNFPTIESLSQFVMRELAEQDIEMLEI